MAENDSLRAKEPCPACGVIGGRLQRSESAIAGAHGEFTAAFEVRCGACGWTSEPVAGVFGTRDALARWAAGRGRLACTE